MKLDLDDAALFLRVAELGSLSAVARERDMPVSQVSRTLVRLEARCGARLMHRSTHGLSLTDEGDTFAAHARRLLDTRDELAAAFRHKRAGPSGWVRLSVSPGLAQSVIVPSLPSLYEAHPQLQVEVLADDRMSDMAREGVDIAIRTGSPQGDNLVARQIAEHGRQHRQQGAEQHDPHLGRHEAHEPGHAYGQHAGGKEAAQHALYGFTRADGRGQLVLAERLAEKIRARICRPDQAHHEQQDPGPHHGVVIEVVPTDGHQ